MIRNAVALIALSFVAAPVEFPRMESKTLLEHIKVMSSDRFEGRAPGTAGEDLTVSYVESQFKNAGLQPGNPDGTYIQKVPMIGITPDTAMSLSYGKGKAMTRLKYLDDYVAWTRRIAPEISLKDSPLLFVGYGVQAPEFNWDDYKGVDTRGKVLVMLVNDPPVPSAADPSKLDPKIFGGNAMTYYGRWTYKYDIGAEKGAAGILLVHETGPAGYGWTVVQGFGGERFDLITPDKNMGKAGFEAWIGLEQAKRLFVASGQDFTSLKKQAATRAFRPVPLNLNASITLRNKMRTIASKNVVGKLTGSDSKLKEEYVVFTAHWDHLGVGQPVNGDRIYHGAVDNASGVAGLIEVSRAFKKASPPPKRSILFLAVTGEEQGLLGSEHYAANPLYPLAKTLAEINMDGMNVNGRTKDVTIVGLGNSDLDDYARRVAARQGRVLASDPEPEKGFYYRSDHFPFAQKGVPGLNPDSGINYIGKPPGYGKKLRDKYNENDYHKPSDVIKPDWDLSGMIEDLQFLWMVGYEVANAEHYPQWKPGTEFKATRESQLKAAGAAK
jgi:Zn-dependent M28 family amino/carboxypeptidase